MCHDIVKRVVLRLVEIRYVKSDSGA